MFVIAAASLLWAVIGFAKKSRWPPRVAKIEPALQAFLLTHLFVTAMAFWTGLFGLDPSIAYDLGLPAGLLAALAVIVVRRMRLKAGERAPIGTPYRIAAKPVHTGGLQLPVSPDRAVLQGVIGIGGAIIACGLAFTTPEFCSWFPGTCSSRTLAGLVARSEGDWVPRREFSWGGTGCHSASEPQVVDRPKAEYRVLASRGHAAESAVVSVLSRLPLDYFSYEKTVEGPYGYEYRHDVSRGVYLIELLAGSANEAALSELKRWYCGKTEGSVRAAAGRALATAGRPSHHTCEAEPN